MSLAHETFETFKALGLKHGLFTEEAIRPAPFMWRLDQWALDFIFKHHHFPDQPYDHVWVLQPVFRAREGGRGVSKKEFRKSRVDVCIVAINSRTNTMQIVVNKYGGRDFQILKNEKHVLAIVREPTGWGYEISGDPNELAQGISYAHAQAIEKLTHKLLAGSRSIVTRDAGYAQALRDKIMGELSLWLHGKFNHVLSSYMAMIDAKAMDFALRYGKKRRTSAQDTAIYIFNHIVAAPQGVARDYRQGALAVLKPTEYFFYQDGNFWSKIDAGNPIYTILATKLNVTSATARHIVRQSEHLKIIPESEITKYAQYLNVLDVSCWPQSLTETSYFKLMMNYAAIYANAFGRDEYQVVRELVKSLDRKQPDRWKFLFERRLNRQRAFLIEQERSSRKNNNKIPNISDLKLLEQYGQELRDLRDMVADINKRVIMPLLIVEFEKRGLEVLKLASIEPMARSLEQKFWANAQPNEQIAASSYWHSARVNFQQRLESVAFTTTDACWKTLVDRPYTDIKVDGKKATFVPLVSDFALKEEGQAMSHCVGGYAINCLRDGYHIFSIRNEDGTRASTFTCRDAPPVEGRPQVTLVQNAAQRNSPSPPWAQKAATEFMRRVNAGKLRADWAAIHESKADFLTHEVDMTIGYNFREKEQRERIYGLYDPLVPRKIPGAARTDIAALAAYLGIEGAVTKYIADAGQLLGEYGIRQKKAAERPQDRNATNPEQGLQHG